MSQDSDNIEPKKNPERSEKQQRGLKRLPDNRWRISWMFQGKYYRRIVDTKSEAKAVLAKIHTSIREERFFDVKKQKICTFEEGVNRYLRWSETSNRRSTYLLDKLCADFWLRFSHFKEKTLNQITGGDVEHYKQALISEKIRNGTRNSGKPLSSRTVDMRIARLKRLFHLCMEWELIDHNPAARVRLLRNDNVRIRYLSEDEEKRLMEAAKLSPKEEQRSRKQGVPLLTDVIQFALNTGMRRGEILGLTWGDIHFQTPVIVIPATRSKGKKDRVIPLNGLALGILKNLSRPADRKKLVFCNKEGNTWDRLRKHWEKAIKKSGIQDFRFHDLRHTFASRLVSAGVDLTIVKELLGHSDYETTLRYAHVRPERFSEAIAVLERFASEQHFSNNSPYGSGGENTDAGVTD